MIRCANLQRNEGKKRIFTGYCKDEGDPSLTGSEATTDWVVVAKIEAATEAEMIAAVFPLTPGSSVAT